MQDKPCVLVIYGGRSTEHEVSCRSAAFVLKNLDRTKYEVRAVAIDKTGRWIPQDVNRLLKELAGPVPIGPAIAQQPALSTAVDPSAALLQMALPSAAGHGAQEVVVFPVLHGANGEDGTMQGLLEMADVAYVGPDTLGSAIGMDKVVSKRLAQAAGIPVVPWIDFKVAAWRSRGRQLADEALSRLGLPLFVKPARLGSSVGVTKVKRADELMAACETAFGFDDKLLVEKGLDVREIECAVMGSDEPEVSIPGEVVPHADFYSYSAKYLSADGASVVIPAKLSPEIAAAARDLSRRVFLALELYGMARIDLFLEKSSGLFFLNEVNTIPGFTEISQFPLLWQASGKTPGAILDRLIALAQERQKIKRSLKRSRD